MQTYILLTVENSVHQLSYIPAYFYYIKNNTMLILMNELHYISYYERLKYGIFIDSSLTAMWYQKKYIYIYI